MSTTPPGRTDDLKTLAHARFGDLTEAEVKLLRAAPKGEWAWCAPSRDNSDPENDPSKADNWGHDREIRAGLIRWLCVDRQTAQMVDPHGIQVHAAKITGNVDFSFVTVPFPLGLFRCRLTDDAYLMHALIPALYLVGSWTRALTADGLRVAGNVFLGEQFTADGPVRLSGAQLGGNLECEGAVLKNPAIKYRPASGAALHADGIKVNGDVILRQGLLAEGEVRLLGAQISGDVDCSGGTFKNAGGTALNADGAYVKGNVFLSQGLTAEGGVRLAGAQIGGDLDCSGSTFKNPADDSISDGGRSINADGVRVAGSIFLRQGFTSEGEVRLSGARVCGNLECQRATFENVGGVPLNADDAIVRGNVFLSEGFIAEGKVRLMGAQVGGDLACRGGRFTELTAQGATITGNFFYLGIPEPRGRKLNLTNASAGAIADDQASWPKKGNLRLDGFTYLRFSKGPRDANSRLNWLSRQHPFTPQPYRQLANVLHEAGDERGAHEVLYEMERLRREQEDRRWYEHLWSWLLRWTIGYGHKTWRALVCLLGLAAMGFVLSGLGYLGGTMAPSQQEAFATFNKTGATPAYYPRFNAAVYSLEHSFPFIDLGERDHWAPAPGGSGRTPVLVWPAFRWMQGFQVGGVHPFRLNAPGFLRFWLWSQIAAGWILATLFVAGLTGIVKSK